MIIFDFTKTVELYLTNQNFIKIIQKYFKNIFTKKIVYRRSYTYYYFLHINYYFLYIRHLNDNKDLESGFKKAI